MREGVLQNGISIPGALWWALNCTETFDTHWLAKGLSGPYHPFPKMPYMPWLFYQLLKEKILFIPKSREMMVSWAVMVYCTWFCMLHERTLVLVQSQKLEKSCELVKGTEPPGYARTLWERQSPWLCERFPLASRLDDLPADRLVWKNGSAIQAVGMGADQVRMYHPTIFIQDEAAHMDEAEASFAAALPVSQQIIVVSSAGPGWFGHICSPD